MKNYLFVLFAAVALLLSSFYEKDSAQPVPAEAPVPAQPVVLLSPDSLTSADSIITQKLALIAPQPEPEKTQEKKAADTKPATGLMATVRAWIGTPYRSGSNTKNGTDCSGFVQRIYQQVYGVHISRSSRSIFDQVTRVPKSQLQEGDIVFFKRPNGPIYHVGIYLKNGRFIHSATNGGVMVNSLRQGYYQSHFYAGGRIQQSDRN